jgi:hypothetical protein
VHHVVAVDVIVQVFEIFDAVRGASDAIDGSRSKAERFSTRSRPPTAYRRSDAKPTSNVSAHEDVGTALFPPHPTFANQQSE